MRRLWRYLFGTRQPGVADSCPMCRISFVRGPSLLKPPPEARIKYAKDGQYGERFLVTCPRCEYRWSVPLSRVQCS